MRLSLLRAKEAFKHKAPAGLLEFRLNRACERLLLHGKFAGSMREISIACPYGQLTLPRQFRTLEGVRLDNNRNYDLANLWFTYMPGIFSPADFNLDIVRDLGDGWATLYTLPAGGTLTVDYPGSETLALAVYGEDTSGKPISVTFSGKQTVDNPFAQITRVHREIIETSDTQISLYHTDAASQITYLAIMDPREEETYYRRYMIDALRADQNAVAQALVKLRHIEFTSDSDILPFSNISAIGLGLDALQAEAESNNTLSDYYFLKAVDLLNKELQDTNADNALPTIRILYPRGCEPQLTSFY